MDLNKAVPPWRRKKGTATRWGCRIKQNWLQEPIEGTWQSIRASACIDLRHLCLLHLVRSYHLGGLVCSLWAKQLPQMYGDQIWNSSLRFHPPPIILAFVSKWGNPPFQTLRFPMRARNQKLQLLPLWRVCQPWIRESACLGTIPFPRNLFWEAWHKGTSNLCIANVAVWTCLEQSCLASISTDNPCYYSLSWEIQRWSCHGGKVVVLSPSCVLVQRGLFIKHLCSTPASVHEKVGWRLGLSHLTSPSCQHHLILRLPIW